MIWKNFWNREIPAKDQHQDAQQACDVQQPDGLLGLLFDKTLELGARDDVAMDLGGYPNDDRVLPALKEVGSDPNEDDMITSSCGESIGEILVEQGEFRREFVENLVPMAKREAIGFIRACKPEWIDKYKLEDLL